MKKHRLTIILVLAIAFITSSCYKRNGDDPEVPVFPYNQPIENPPDEFLVVFNISHPGDRMGEIRFAENAVWEVEKRGDSKANLFFKYEANVLPILSIDSIGFAGLLKYNAIMNNNNYNDMGNYFVGFRKLDVDYDSHDKKFP